jgi:hypothetical protein
MNTQPEALRLAALNWMRISLTNRTLPPPNCSGCTPTPSDITGCCAITASSTGIGHSPRSCAERTKKALARDLTAQLTQSVR